MSGRVQVSRAYLLAPECCGRDLPRANQPATIGERRVCRVCRFVWECYDEDRWSTVRVGRS